ncbi:hypothetical protein LJ656_21440 [Paraburkholderia sp. MMS20-SJTR3]|uniref:Uncharacterized protein n=1 Tax=Paraburkholderia sejongensis TaxID=2886946 RepID=A0ABS8JZ22_9BURK|nr:hypothetical protein [Paraburkholderia sp. MMS20-SJTR3]MCC8395156.1 hypothetical protein [Paraburkholderia sp. MMS20-SJTR3]
MTTRSEIERRLSVLPGLELSGVHHAADMLTLSFGPLHPFTNFKGVVKYMGQWALHVQCHWRLEEAGLIIATIDDLRVSDEEAHANSQRLNEMLVEHDPVVVETVLVDDRACIGLKLTRGFRLTIIRDGVEDEEDWRFFEHLSDATHLVIEGGKIASHSFD